MKTLIKQLLREALSENFFKDKTNIPDYDALLNKDYDQLPNEYKTQKAFVVYLTKNEYIAECAKLQDTTIEQQYQYINQNKVNQYATLMQNGEKFNMGYLNYINKKQEGRHRILAAYNLGQTKVPVLIINHMEIDASINDVINNWKDINISQEGNPYVIYNITNPKEQIQFLETITPNYQEYLLDDILSDIIYNKSVIDKLRNNKEFEYQSKNINLNDYDINSIIPKDILNLNNEELIKMLIAKIEYYLTYDYNKEFLSEIDELNPIDNNNYKINLKSDWDVNFADFKSAKDMLVNVKPFNVNIKKLNDDYFKDKMTPQLISKINNL
jgi:hypothetical protein